MADHPPLLVPPWWVQQMAIRKGITTLVELRDYCRKLTSISDLEIEVVPPGPGRPRSLDESLTELETWDPAVRAARQQLDRVIERLVRPGPRGPGSGPAPPGR